MKKISENKIKINKLENFLNLSPKEIRKLSDKELVKGLRYFRDDLKYDLRKPLSYYKRRKIRDIAEIYISLLSVPAPHKFAPRKKNLKATQDYLGIGKNWKSVIINRPENSEINFKDGFLWNEDRYTKYTMLAFNKFALLENPEKEIKRILRNRKFDLSKIRTGEHILGARKKNDKNEPQYKRGYDYGDSNSGALVLGLLEDVNQLMNMYGIEEANNYWGNWLEGIEIFILKNQKKKGKKKFKSKIGKNINRNKRKLSNAKKTGSSRRL